MTKLKVSGGNSKIGKIPNLSLTPGASCAPGISCFEEGCYAKQSYIMYPNVRNAWDSNLLLYKENPDKFFDELDSYLHRKKPERFRLFVGGDFPDESFYLRVCQVINRHPKTNFLVFTKRYEYGFERKPYNLQVILSTWPGLELPENTNLPWAWLEEDPRRPINEAYLRCPGNCSDCSHKCWDVVSKDLPVFFPKH